MTEPAATASAIAGELKQFVERNVQSNLQLLSRAGGVLREAAQAARDPQRLRGADARSLLEDLFRLQLDYLKDLSASSAQYLGAVVSLAESALPPRRGERAAVAPGPTEAAAPASTPTALGGRAGETVAFQFRIDNPNAEPVNAAIEVRDWTADGDAFAAHNVSFEPAATVLEPGMNRMVQGRIVTDARFRAGRSYDTVIRVVGFPGREVPVRLTVDDGGAG